MFTPGLFCGGLSALSVVFERVPLFFRRFGFGGLFGERLNFARPLKISGFFEEGFVAALRAAELSFVRVEEAKHGRVLWCPL